MFYIHIYLILLIHITYTCLHILFTGWHLSHFHGQDKVVVTPKKMLRILLQESSLLHAVNTALSFFW